MRLVKSNTVRYSEVCSLCFCNIFLHIFIILFTFFGKSTLLQNFLILNNRPSFKLRNSHHYDLFTLILSFCEDYFNFSSYWRNRAEQNTPGNKDPKRYNHFPNSAINIDFYFIFILNKEKMIIDSFGENKLENHVTKFQKWWLYESITSNVTIWRNTHSNSHIHCYPLPQVSSCYNRDKG